MASTARSSISVKPRRGVTLSASPFTIRTSIDAVPGCERIDVEHVLARPRLLGRAGVAAFAPGVGRGELRVGVERVARHAAQEVDALAARVPLVFDAFDQVLEAPRIARLADAPQDAAFVARLLVGVERGADL